MNAALQKNININISRQHRLELRLEVGENR